MTENIENAKTLESSDADVEKQEIKGDNLVNLDAAAVENNLNNNHFFEEKVKESVPPGINGSLVFLYALFFSVFTIGWVNLNRCPLNRLIPIYLILAGSLGALAKHLSKYENKYCFYSTIFLVIVDVVWHCLGSYVVYKEYQPNYDPKYGLYCNRTTYLVAFWTLTIEYTLLLLFILLSCFYMIMRRDFRTD